MPSRFGSPNKRLQKRTAPTKSPTMFDIAWAAGIWEGEGGVSFRAHKRTSLIMQVTQKDTWLLEKFKELFGGSFHKVKGGGCHRWILSGPRGWGFALTIFPFLSPRRRVQIRKAMEV